jgi:hypothetical protein
MKGGNLPEARILSYTGRPTKKTHATAFPLADPSISGQLPGSRLTGHLDYWPGTCPGNALIRHWACRRSPFQFRSSAEQMVRYVFLFHRDNDQGEVILKISVAECDHLFADCSQQFGSAQSNVATAQLKQSCLSKFLFSRIHCFG